MPPAGGYRQGSRSPKVGGLGSARDEIGKSMNLDQCVITGVDVETTGLDTWTDRIVEFGVGHMVDGCVKRLYTKMVKPDIPIPDDASRINGITDAIVKSAPNLSEVWAVQNMAIVMPGQPSHAWLAHHATFDRQMLLHDGVRQGVQPIMLSRLLSRPWLDTRLLARALDDAPAGANGYSLVDLVKRFNVPTVGATHRAGPDVFAMFGLFEALRPRLPATLSGCLKLQADYVAKGRGDR